LVILTDLSRINIFKTGLKTYFLLSCWEVELTFSFHMNVIYSVINHTQKIKFSTPESLSKFPSLNVSNCFTKYIFQNLEKKSVFIRSCKICIRLHSEHTHTHTHNHSPLFNHGVLGPLFENPAHSERK